MKLFLDDYRVPADCSLYMYQRGINCDIYREKWEIVRSYKQFIEWITKNGLPDIISFDHDLGDEFYDPEEYGSEVYNEEYDNFEFKSGYDCAKWLIEYCMDNNKPLPKYIIHSMNPVGSKNIESLLASFLASKVLIS
jgi:hypothetical protein